LTEDCSVRPAQLHLDDVAFIVVLILLLSRNCAALDRMCNAVYLLTGYVISSNRAQNAGSLGPFAIFEGDLCAFDSDSPDGTQQSVAFAICPFSARGRVRFLLTTP